MVVDLAKKRVRALRWYHANKQLKGGRQWHPCTAEGCAGQYNWSQDKVCHKHQKALEYQRHKEARMQSFYAWAKRNPAKKNAIQNRRRARGGSFTSAAWESLKSLFGHLCVYCHTRISKLEIDHILPMSKGGRHEAGNVVPSCRSCNARKGAAV